MMKWLEIQKKHFKWELDETYNIYKDVNKDYKGGDIIVIKSSPSKIISFIEELYQINPEYIQYIKEVILRYSSSEYRGWGYNTSFLHIDKNFANKIKLQGYFKWIDRGWGEFRAGLSYDLSNL